MSVRAYRPNDVTHERWVRDVSRFLNGMLRVDEVVTYRHEPARLPVSLRVSTPRVPLSVLVLRAEDLDDRSLQSGNRISWSWDNGKLVVSGIENVSSGSHRVTLGLILEKRDA